MESKTHLILLCAGASKRMGFPKGLLLWQGRPLLQHQIEHFLALDFLDGQGQIILVLGHHHERYRDCLIQSLDQKSLARVQIVMNLEPDRGQFSSLQEAVKIIDPRSWAFLLPIDCPAPGGEVWETLWRARDEHTSVLIPSLVNTKQSGHPLLIGEKFLQHLGQCSTETRLDAVIQAWGPNEKKYVEVKDAGICANINVPIHA